MNEQEAATRIAKLEGQVAAMNEALKLLITDKQHCDALYQLLQASKEASEAAKAYREWMGQFPKPDDVTTTGG